jgi:polyisoprenoid-binding protein YceI
MKKTIIILAIASTLFSFQAFAPTLWSLDHVHSKLGFSITHLMVSEVEGSFRMTEATITASKEDFSDAVVLMTADVNSVDTDNTDRDAHLKKDDFFDAAKYPTMTFRSSSFKKVTDKKYSVKGDLTIHGVTKPVELDAAVNFGTNPMSKKTIAGFRVTGKVKRSDFGIAPSTPSAMLGDEVAIVAKRPVRKGLMGEL